MKTANFTLVLVLWLTIVGISFGQNLEDEVEEQYYTVVFGQSDASIQEQVTAFTAFAVDIIKDEDENSLNTETHFHDTLFNKVDASIKEQLIVFTAFTVNATEEE